jgi:hypothetical protein
MSCLVRLACSCKEALPLYNNGFVAGFVAVAVVQVLERFFSKTKRKKELRKKFFLI